MDRTMEAAIEIHEKNHDIPSHSDFVVSYCGNFCILEIVKNSWFLGGIKTTYAIYELIGSNYVLKGFLPGRVKGIPEA